MSSSGDSQIKIDEDTMDLTLKERNILDFIWKAAMNTLGIILIVFFGMLYYFLVLSFIYDNVLMYHLYMENIYITLTILLIGLWLGKKYQIQNPLAFNIIFNYVLSVLISPGITSVFFIKHGPQQEPNLAPFVYDPTKSEFNKSVIYKKLDGNTLEYCRKCQLPKPERAHHCSLCNTCVLKMDHHCPWLNQCVGYQNHRHFLLFLFYVFAGTTYVSLLNIPIMFTDLFEQVYDYRTDWFSILWPLNLSLSIMMAFFSAWSWFLALSGQTTIEFWGKKLPNSRGKKYDYASKNRVKNLQSVFGNFDYLWQIFVPSVRDLPSNGIYWEKVQDQEDEEEQIDEVQQQEQQEQLAKEEDKLIEGI